MVGEAVIREVVGANLVAAVAAADHRLPLGGPLLLLFLLIMLVQSRLENAERLRKVLMLAFFILH